MINIIIIRDYLYLFKIIRIGFFPNWMSLGLVININNQKLRNKIKLFYIDIQMRKNKDIAIGNTVVIAMIIISIPINLIINYYYSDSLYQLGARLILQMQKYSNPLLDYFFIFFTLIVDPIFVAACCILFLLLTKQKLSSFVLTVFIMFNTYFLTITKSFYIAPRPYWTHQSIKNIGYYCPKDYGNPSGHSEFAAIMACVLLFQFVKQRSWISIFLAIVLMVGVSISRMYLGGHSLNQVTQGLYLGISLSSLYCYGGLQSFIANLIVKQRSPRYKKLLIAIIVCMHSMYIYAYWNNTQKSQQHQKQAKIWIKNYNQKCKKSIDENYLNFVMVNLNAVLTNLITGIIFGFKNMLGLENINHYMKGKWQLNTVKYHNKIICYAIMIVVQVLLFAIGFICFFPVIFLFNRNNLTNFIYNNISILVSSYFYSSFSFKIFTKIELMTFNAAKSQPINKIQ